MINRLVCNGSRYITASNFFATTDKQIVVTIYNGLIASNGYIVSQGGSTLSNRTFALFVDAGTIKCTWRGTEFTVGSLPVNLIGRVVFTLNITALTYSLTVDAISIFSGSFTAGTDSPGAFLLRLGALGDTDTTSDTGGASVLASSSFLGDVTIAVTRTNDSVETRTYQMPASGTTVTESTGSQDGTLRGNSSSDFETVARILFVRATIDSDTDLLNYIAVTLGYAAETRAITSAYQASHSVGYDLTIISAKGASGNSANTLSCTGPVINLEGFSWDDMQIATGIGSNASATSINVINDAHPIAGSQSNGSLTFASAAQLQFYATATSGATVIADTGTTGQAVVIAVEAGATLENSSAALARRVGIGFIGSDTATSFDELTAGALDIFSSSISWALSEGASSGAPTISGASNVRAGGTVTLTVDTYDTVSSVTYGGITLSDVVEATGTTITATMPVGGLALGSSNAFVVTDANGTSNSFSAQYLPRTGYDYFTLTADSSTFESGTAFYDIGAVTGDQVEYEINIDPADVNITDVDASTGTPTLDGVISVESTSNWYVWDASDTYSVGTAGTTTWTVGGVVIAPIVAPAPGNYVDSVDISITTETSGATIYYTTDGSDPTESSSVYSAPFTLSSSAVVKAFATLTDYDDSSIATNSYTVQPKVATPVITPDYGLYSNTAEVSISVETEGATIYYTDDGIDPDSEAIEYTGTFTVTEDTIIKAVAILDGYFDSDIQSVVIDVIPTVATPTFSPSSGIFETTVNITLDCSTPSATIYYTTDGSLPDATDNEYSAPFAITETTTIRAIAILADYNNSSVSTKKYTESADVVLDGGSGVIGPVIGKVIGSTIGSVFSSGSGSGGSSPTIADPTFEVYTAPADVVAAYASDRYSMTVSQDGSAPVSSFLFMDVNDNGTQVSANTMDYMQVANHFTKFRTDDPVTVTISMLDSTPITSCVIRPLELGISANISGSSVSFVLPAPHFVSVEINETYSKTASYTGIGTITKKICKHPVLIFAAPIEDDVPAVGAPGVTRYAPGIHSIGLNQALPDSTHIYLEGWAVLVGGYATTQANPSNIKIHGNGVITGKTASDASLTNTGSGWVDHAIALAAIGQGSNGTNNEITGITIAAPMRSCIVSYNAIHLEWVSMTSWQHRRDGLTSGNGSSSAGEIFIKSQDDQNKVYYRDQDHQAHFIIWQQTSGSPFKFGWNTSSDVYGVYYDKVTIIHSNVFYDIDPDEIDRQDLNSTSALFSAMGYNTGGRTSGVVINEIVIEEENLLRFMGLRLQSYHEGEYFGNPDSAVIISGIVINRLTMPSAPICGSFAYANAGGSIGDIIFRNVTIGGEVISAYDMLPSVNDGPGMTLVANGGGTISHSTFSPRNFTEISTNQYFDLGASFTADRIVMEVYPNSANTGLPTGVPAVTASVLQELDYTLSGGSIQYVGRNGANYFDGYIKEVKIYNGSTLLVDAPLDEDFSGTTKARNRAATLAVDSAQAPNTLTSPWVNNGDGSYSINGSQTSNRNLYYSNVLTLNNDYLLIVTVSNCSAGGVRVYSSDINTETFTTGNGTFEFPFTPTSNDDINVQAQSTFSGTVTFQIVDVTVAPAYLTAVNISSSELLYLDVDATPDEWANVGDTVVLEVA